MAGITYFVAVPFDVADGGVVVGEPIECLSPAAAIERAQCDLTAVLRGERLGYQGGEQSRRSRVLSDHVPVLVCLCE